MAGEVLVEHIDRIAIITINRPHARNAINYAVSAGMAQAFGELDERADLTVGIITGAGGIFSSGMDLNDDFEFPRTSPGRSVVDELQRAARAEPDRLAGTVGRLARGLGLKDRNDTLFFVQLKYARIGQNALARANATIGVRDNTHMWL